MKCPECRLVEMIQDKVEDGKVHLLCRKCGKTVVLDEQEYEELINKDTT